MTEDTTLPPMDDDVPMSSDGRTEEELLDAVLAASNFVEEQAEPLPEQEVPEVDPVEADEIEDPEESEETVTDEEYDDEAEEAEDEDDSEEESTQDADVFTADDLDLDARVRVKVDGEEMDISFADLLKGYQTDASLSKKGRELGDARKEMEEEREASLKEIQDLGAASTAILLGTEDQLSKDYHDLESKIEKARQEGDTYEVNELKDQREQVQKRYWQARNYRESLQGQLKEQQEKINDEIWQKQLEYFNDNIQDMVPGFDADMAVEIREFGLAEGISEEIIDTVADPTIIKVLNDYRLLKQGVQKGEAKRKAVPQKKALPTKKARTNVQKKADASKVIRERAMTENASETDQMAFLREYANKSLNL